jgi:hypothetical protein
VRNLSPPAHHQGAVEGREEGADAEGGTGTDRNPLRQEGGQAPDTLEDAIYAAVYTPANPLPHGARTLIDIRYREDKQGELELHTEFADWVIDRVWGELGDELPPDLAGLLPEEEDWV